MASNLTSELQGEKANITRIEQELDAKKKEITALKAQLDEAKKKNGYIPARRHKSGMFLTDLDFEIVPFVDTIILLLMFVVVTTSFRGQPGIKVELPTAASSAQDIPQYTEVVISQEGKIYLGHTEFAGIETLGPELKTRASMSPSKILFVRADRNTRHGLVVAVIDAAKRAGFIEVTIATTSAQE